MSDLTATDCGMRTTRTRAATVTDGTTVDVFGTSGISLFSWTEGEIGTASTDMLIGATITFLDDDSGTATLYVRWDESGDADDADEAETLTVGNELNIRGRYDVSNLRLHSSGGDAKVRVSPQVRSN